MASKDTLIDAAWSGLAVEESSLTVEMAAARLPLGEVPGGEDWIATLPRTGYRVRRAGSAPRRNNAIAYFVAIASFEFGSTVKSPLNPFRLDAGASEIRKSPST